MNKSKDLWVHSGNLLPTLNFIFTFAIAIYIIVGNQIIPSSYLIILLAFSLYVLNPFLSEKYSRRKLNVIKKSEEYWDITSDNPNKYPELNFQLKFENIKEISLENRYPDFHFIIEKNNGYSYNLTERMSLVRKGSLIHFAYFIKKKANIWNQSNPIQIKIKDNFRINSLVNYLSNKYFLYLLFLISLAATIMVFRLYNHSLNFLLLTIIILLGIRLSIAIAYYYKIISEQDFGKEEVLDHEIEW